jgi:hypothetical protein
MLIAAQKKKENIAEYIIYMYQIEDIIRSNNFDIEKIKETVISGFKVEEDIKEEMIEWYIDLIKRMKDEGIEKKGHLKFIKDIIDELFKLHKELINSVDELKYIKHYNEAKPALEEFRQKTESELNEIEICLTGLYGLFIMRLKQQDISEATENALNSFRNVMSLLSDKYKLKLEG